MWSWWCLAAQHFNWRSNCFILQWKKANPISCQVLCSFLHTYQDVLLFLLQHHYLFLDVFSTRLNGFCLPFKKVISLVFCCFMLFTSLYPQTRHLGWMWLDCHSLLLNFLFYRCRRKDSWGLLSLPSLFLSFPYIHILLHVSYTLAQSERKKRVDLKSVCWTFYDTIYKRFHVSWELLVCIRKSALNIFLWILKIKPFCLHILEEQIKKFCYTLFGFS